ncbi:MAG: hypothetical protein QOG38_89 [Hyphomicrobiales bacterium]|jgi:hypothetical protein|nr:hypothetical protein [Hyphomicrobiales bacterium]
MRPATRDTRAKRPSVCVLGILAAFAGITIAPAAAQDDLLRPGEAYATRFSGTTSANGPDGKPQVTIDPAGTVGSIIDIRAPGRRPAGEHWVDEPQRKPVTAREVGQVFGVALDAEGPPNIYLSATSAFGLHRNADNSQWMDGMWGADGGPGTIYRLDRDAGYKPRVFATVTLNGRQNSGPGLGNIAFDKWNKQIFVSDLETGMIHRFKAQDGADLGFYDHGTQGRPKFLDVTGGKPGSLPPIPFDPALKARITDCPSGKFDNAAECWNFALSGRRVWGLAAWKHPQTGETRLYYSVWSSPAFGDPSWDVIKDESDKRNSIWSVKLDPEGGFVADDVRREFVMPDFFKDPAVIARNGYSSPVSDIAFPECGGTARMLLGERGGIRNLGLDVDKPFAAPHEARAFQVGLTQQGSWRVLGRYDVGFYSRRLDGEPFVRANCAGGVAFGPGYTPDGRADLSKPNQFAWISGDSLCSVDGPCNNPAGARPAPGPQPPNTPRTVSDEQSFEPDDAEVHGLQGMPVNLFSEIIPPPNANDQAAGPDQAYLIDLDINVDPTGAVIPETLFRNDATKIGDVAIYQVCDAPEAFEFPPPAIGHWPVFSHSRSGSHNPQYSHYRHGTHNPKLSHERARSHTRSMTHHRHISRRPEGGTPRAQQVHPSERSHNREISIHRQPRSHNPRVSGDIPVLSHNRRLSHPTERTHNPRVSHRPRLSHNERISNEHKPPRSHNERLSNEHPPQRSHNPRISDPHSTERSHNPRISKPHSPERSHNPRISNPHKPVGSHNQRISNPHKPVGSHNTRISGHKPVGSHNARISNAPKAVPQRQVPQQRGGRQFIR